MNFFSKEEKDFLSSASNSEQLTDGPKKEHPLTEIIRFAILALIIVLPIRLFIAQPFIVSGASMESTFHNGSYLIVDQLSYYLDEPKRGDVIIFKYPEDHSKFFIKRIIGLPGDTIEINGDKITIYNDANPQGFVLNEPYVDQMSPVSLTSATLGEDEYYVMGDNRDASLDSRRWGVLREDEIIGRAFLRLFPINEIGILPGQHELKEQITSPN